MSAGRDDAIRWLKFNAVGAGGICVQLGALALLTSAAGLNYLLATALAVEAAVLNNFFWHKRFTWRDRKSRNGVWRLVKFNLSTGTLSIVGNVLAMKLLVDAIGLPYLFANLLSITLCSIVNFLIADRFIFLPGPPERQSM